LFRSREQAPGVTVGGEQVRDGAHLVAGVAQVAKPRRVTQRDQGVQLGAGEVVAAGPTALASRWGGSGSRQRRGHQGRPLRAVVLAGGRGGGGAPQLGGGPFL